MARKRTQPSAPESRAVTEERAARLHRLLTILAAGAQTRAGLARRLKLDVRGFYRDLELLRAAGIAIPLKNRRYSIAGDPKQAIARLPFPDPRLTLGEAMSLAKGRTAVHRKLREQVNRVVR